MVLLSLLTESQAFGFLGPGPVDDQLQRALAFAEVTEPQPGSLSVDLGTGGGLPGLVLATLWPGSRWVLVDANRRRAGWLRGAISRLNLLERVEVLNQRAEEVGRGPLRARAMLVTARSFAPPAATAECGAPLLAVGGSMVVSDPPLGSCSVEDRWPQAGLSQLGLRFIAQPAVPSLAGPVTLAVLEQGEPCPLTYPRRAGLPEKRPLFG